MKTKIITALLCLLTQWSFSQNFGNFPKIEKEKLVRDLDLLYQGLDKFHSGMYWYTSKDSVDLAFQNAKAKITTDLNVLEFHKLIAPLVGLSREDHTDISLPKSCKEEINKNGAIRLLPLTVVFLGEKLYCIKNASNNPVKIEALEIEQINGETPAAIVSKTGSLFASDGYIKSVKFSDLKGLNFAKYYYYYYGIVDSFQLKIKDMPGLVAIQSLPLTQINNNLNKIATATSPTSSEPLDFQTINSKTAYLTINTFSNSKIKQLSRYKTLSSFLETSFAEIERRGVENLIVDISKNGGGTEGNEGLLYSYFGDNYQKYLKVRAKSQKVVLDNGIDPSVTLKTFGFFEKTFLNNRKKDGSYERKPTIGRGLMAYKRKPKNTFKGKIYVIISPVTYSGGSEFSNMMYSRGLATFVGQESGGGYFGNTSGYSRELILPNSKIAIDIPALQFVMNVEPKLPFGSGVIPHYEVIPTIEQYMKNENVCLDYILNLITEKK